MNVVAFIPWEPGPWLVGPLVAVLTGLWAYLRYRHRNWLEKQGLGYNRNSFHTWVRSGDLTIVERFLRAGMKPSVTSADGQLALVEAVKASQVETARLLLCRTERLRHRLRRLLRRAASDPDQPDRTGLRPLSAAVLIGSAELVDLLEEAGAAPAFAKDARLVAAAQMGNVKQVEHWIGAGADLETRSLGGNTPLIEVASLPGGNPAVLRALIAAGARIDALSMRPQTARGPRAGPPTASRRTALMEAAVSGNEGCAEVLLEVRSDPGFLEAVDQDGNTAFMLARRWNNPAVESLLRRYKARPIGLEGSEQQRELQKQLAELIRGNFRSDRLAEITSNPEFHPDGRAPDGRTLAAAAAGADRDDAVERLLDTGADPDLAGDDGEAPIHAAARQGSAKATRVLLARGAKAGLRTAGGDTALHLASDSGSAEIVEELIRHRVDVNARGRDNVSALLVAVGKGRREVVDRLLAAGADPDTADRHGRTPLLVARLRGYEEIASMLAEAGATRGEPEARLILAAERGDEAGVTRLLEDGASAKVLAGNRSALLGAAQRGRTKIVELLLGADEQQRPDPNQADARGSTPLMLAAARGHLQVIGSLLAARVKVNARRRDGGTALLGACAGGHTQVVSELLRHGARVDLTRKDGRSALMLAVEEGNLDIARSLIDNGADVDAVSHNGESPLMLALLVNDQPMVDLLRQEGARIGQLEAELFLAVVRGDAQRVRELIDQGAPVDAQAKKWKVPLLVAVERNHLPVVNALVRAGANVNDQRWRRTSPLMRAARDGHLKVTEYLLANGAAVDLRGSGGATPLMLACERQHTDTARALLREGADVDARDDDGRTPLMIAILEGHERLYKLLSDEPYRATAGEDEAGLILAAEAGQTERARFFLGRNADPNAIGTRHRTALVAACEQGADELAKALLEADADPGLPGPLGKTPLTAAASSGNVALVSRLLEAAAAPDVPGEQGKTPLIVAAEAGRWEVAARLLAAEANLNAADTKGRTALMLAAEAGRMETVGLLLGAGAEIDARDRHQRTALMAAALADQSDTMGALLKAGAAVDATDENNSTALILACLVGREAAVQELLRADADCDARDSFGNTPLMAAILEENFEIETLLREAGASEGELEARLLKAAERGDASETARLILGGVNVNARRSGDDSALVLACWTRKGAGPAVAQALVEQGADVTVRGRHGRTALMGAARNGHLAVAEKLLDAGACAVVEALSADSDQGPLYTATLLAADAGYRQIVELLAERCDALGPDDPVFVTEHGDRYHRARCAYVPPGSDRPTLRHALELRKRPCSYCLSRQ